MLVYVIKYPGIIKKVFTCLVISLFVYTGIQAQEFGHIHYDIKDGLPSNTIYDITQDKSGFIWFATENGLTKFDGLHFKTFTTRDGLPDNAILKVHGDEKGRVYFIPFTHTPYFYYNDSIYKLKVAARQQADLTNTSYFFNNGDQVVLVAASDSYLLNSKDSLVSLNEVYKNIPEKNLVLAVTNDLIITFVDNKFFYIKNDGSINSKNKYENKKILRYFNFEGHLITLETTSLTPLSKSGNLSDKLFYANEGDSVYFFNPLSGRFLYKIRIKKFSNAFIDNENSLWITTLGNGVYRFPSFEYKYLNVAKFDEIFSITRFNNNLILGGDFSKTLRIPLTGPVNTYTLFDYSAYIYGSQNTTTQFSKRNRIYKLLNNKESIYIGTDAFLLKQSKSSKPLFKNAYPIKDIDTINNKLLVCTGINVLLLNASDLSVIDTLLNQRSTSGVFYNNDFYVGTLGGLVKINSADKSVQSLNFLHPALKRRIISIQRGINKDLWIATSGAGLVHFINGKIKNVFTTASGITSDICTSLYIDSTDIWLGTNEGLNRIITNSDSTRIITFTTANGLNSDFVSSLFVHEKMVYVGSPNGLTYFNKDATENKSICVLHITQVSQGSKQLGTDSLYTFPHNALNIKIDFTAISFKSAGDNRYFYRLEGLDTAWNTTRNTFIAYATLPPGNYRLKIKAINKFGVESKTKEMVIIIIPPWWQTWLFRLGTILLVAALIYFIYRKNIHSIRKREENKRVIEAKFAALEQQALQAQMNPHFIFNCLNSIQSFIIDLDVEGANKYLSIFASMIRQTLENSSHLLVPFSNELKYLDTYLQLEKLRFKDKFNYFIEIDEEIDQQNTLIPGMLLQPYIENSLRHGIQHRKDNKGLISLQFRSGNHKSLLCTIKDNGVGRRKSGEMKSVQHIEYQSRGTFINEKRIMAINNLFNTNISVLTDDILNTDGSVEGTLVKLFIPFFPKTIS
ncbi:MAG TPA: histidine kinase [Chitinophagaceae bacterium]